MSLSSIEFQCGDVEEIDTFLANRIYEFNAEATGYHDAQTYAAVQRDGAGTIVAGISGFTWGGVCFISNLWVCAALRGNGTGRALVRMAERNATDKGCVVALLSTHSFQSPGFYERMGFERCVSVRDYPVGHTDIFYAKRLAPRLRDADDAARTRDARFASGG